MSTVDAVRLPVPAYRDGNVLRWLAGFSLSLLGDQIFFIGLAWAAAQVAAPAQVGLILAAGSIPRAVLLPFGGAIADRFGPKGLIVVSDGVRAAVMVVFAAVLFAGRPSVAILAGLAVVFGLVDAVFLPAVGALPPRLVDAGQLARLQAMRGLAQRASIIVGAPLAGWIAARYGLPAAFGLTAVLFAVSVPALLFTRVRPLPASGPAPDRPAGVTGLTRDVRAAWRYVRGHGLLGPLLILSGATEFCFTGPMNTGLPLLAAERGWGPEGIGIMLGGFGVGAAATALLVVVLGRLPRAGAVSCVGVVVMGAALAMMGVAPGRWWAAAAAAGLGLASGVAGGLFGALVTTITDPGQLGRVMAFSLLVSFGGIPVSYTVTGLITEVTSAPVPFYIGGSLSVVAGLLGLAHRGVRRAELARP
jgi:MFS family permease